MDAHTQGQLRAALGAQTTDQNFRDDVRMTYSKRLVYLLATELVAGIELDRPRTDWALTYRPEHMETVLKTVTLAHGQPLLGPPQTDHHRKGADPRNGWPHIGVLAILAFALLVGIVAVFIPRAPPMASSVIGTVWIVGSTCFGLLLFWVNQTSDWPEMQHNPLVWMYLPFDLALLWTIWGPARPNRSWVSLYLVMRLALGCAILLASPFLFELSTPFAPKILNLAGLALLWRVCARGETSPMAVQSQGLSKHPSGGEA